MRKEISEYFEKRLGELEKDSQQLEEELAKNKSSYMDVDKGNIETNKYFGLDTDMKKINEEKEKVTKEQDEIKEWSEKQEKAEKVLSQLPQQEEMLLKDKKQCEEEIDKTRNRSVIDKDGKFTKTNEQMEYEKDLEKINNELNSIDNIKEENMTVAKMMSEKIKFYMEEHNIEEEKEGEPTNTEPVEPTNPEPREPSHGQTLEEKTNADLLSDAMAATSLGDWDEEEKKNKFSQQRPDTNLEPAEPTNPEPVQPTNPEPVQPNNPQQPQLPPQPTKKAVAKLAVSRNVRGIEINGEYMSYKEVEQSSSNERIKQSKEEYLNSIEGKDRLDPMIVDAMLLNYKKNVEKLNKNEEHLTDEEVYSKINEEKKKLKDWLKEYGNIASKNNKNETKDSNVSIKYDLKIKLRDRFKMFTRREIKGLKNEAYNARNYADVEMGRLTQYQFTRRELREYRAEKLLPDYTKPVEGMTKESRATKDKIINPKDIAKATEEGAKEARNQWIEGAKEARKQLREGTEKARNQWREGLRLKGPQKNKASQLQKAEQAQKAEQVQQGPADKDKKDKEDKEVEEAIAYVKNGFQSTEQIAQSQNGEQKDSGDRDDK